MDATRAGNIIDDASQMEKVEIIFDLVRERSVQRHIASLYGGLHDSFVKLECMDILIRRLGKTDLERKYWVFTTTSIRRICSILDLKD